MSQFRISVRFQHRQRPPLHGWWFVFNMFIGMCFSIKMLFNNRRKKREINRLFSNHFQTFSIFHFSWSDCRVVYFIFYSYFRVLIIAHFVVVFYILSNILCFRILSLAIKLYLSSVRFFSLIISFYLCVWFSTCVYPSSATLTIHHRLIRPFRAHVFHHANLDFPHVSGSDLRRLSKSTRGLKKNKRNGGDLQFVAKRGKQFCRCLNLSRKNMKTFCILICLQNLPAVRAIWLRNLLSIRKNVYIF